MIWIKTTNLMELPPQVVLHSYTIVVMTLAKVPMKTSLMAFNLLLKRSNSSSNEASATLHKVITKDSSSSSSSKISNFRSIN